MLEICNHTRAMMAYKLKLKAAVEAETQALWAFQIDGTRIVGLEWYRALERMESLREILTKYESRYEAWELNQLYTVFLPKWAI